MLNDAGITTAKGGVFHPIQVTEFCVGTEPTTMLETTAVAAVLAPTPYGSNQIRHSVERPVRELPQLPDPTTERTSAYRTAETRTRNTGKDSPHR